LPPLTEDRRRELVKQVKSRVEESKVALRNVRREGMESLKELESEKMISEDEQRRGGEKLQDLVDKSTKELELIGSHKEAEVLEI
jgi:ribosome recycling factor